MQQTVWFLIVVDLLQCDKLTQRGDRLQFRVREFVLSINSLVNCYLHLANVVGNVILPEECLWIFASICN